MQALQTDVAEKVSGKSAGSGFAAAADAKAVFENAMKRFGVTDVFKLEAMLKKDKAKKKEVMNILNEEIQKSGLKMSPSAVFKQGMREKKADEYRRGLVAKLLGVEKEYEKTISKLQGLFDSVADQSGEKNVFKFYYKYKTDPKFREKANAILMKEIQSDPELAKLGSENPEKVMDTLARLKASYMSKTDVLKFAISETAKRAPIEFAKHGAETFGKFASALLLAPMQAIINAVPGLGEAVKHASESLSGIADAFRKVPQAVANASTVQQSPLEQVQAIQRELFKKASEEASRMYKIS